MRAMKRHRSIASLALGLCACSASHSATHETIHVVSSSFAPGGSIPQRYTCNGADISPALAWNAPQSTRSFALVATDPDSPLHLVFGPFVHWIVYGLPARARGLPENIKKGGISAEGLRQGRNGFDQIGYGGPCPPGGSVHRYLFTIYALDAELDIPPGVNVKELNAAMRAHIIGEGSISAHYK